MNFSGTALRIVGLTLLAMAALSPAARAGHNWPPADGSSGFNKTVLVVPMVHQDPPCPVDPDVNGPCEWLKEGPPATPRHTPAQYEAMFNQEINDYYLLATYGQTTFAFTVASDAGGWFLAPHNVNEYVASPDQISGDGLGVDALNLASAAGYNLGSYSRIVVLHNFPRNAGTFVPAIHFNNQQWPLIFNLEGVDDAGLVATLAHELGHSLGLPDLYAQPNDCDHPGECGLWAGWGPWGLMAHAWSFNHFGAYSKIEAGWIPIFPNRVKDFWLSPTPLTSSFAVKNIAEWGVNVARIRLTNEPDFVGYYVECRIAKPGLGDENVPENGLLVYKVDERFDNDNMCNRHASVFGYGASLEICDAGYGPGESFHDSMNGITILNTGMSADDCGVQVVLEGNYSWPEPAIADHPPLSFDSPDVWVDSQVNGWGNYGPPAQTVDVDGAPDGPGDPIWVGQPHRIYFRVRNLGNVDAQSVQVEVGIRQPAVLPLTCGAPGPVTIIGTKTINNLKPEFTFGPVVDFVSWTPASIAPAHIEVRILPYPGELSGANNLARDLVEFQVSEYAMAGDPPVAVHTSLSITNPCDDIGRLAALPWRASPEWRVLVDPIGPVIDPGESRDLAITANYLATGFEADHLDSTILVAASVGDYMTGREGTYEIIGGMDLIHLRLQEGMVSCSTPGTPVDLGAAFDVVGDVEPSLDRSPVALEYTAPSGTTTLQVTQTSFGTYRDSFFPDEPGDWSVRALWAAEESHAAAESTPCAVTVVAPCTAPAMELEITAADVTSSGDTRFHFTDPNPGWQVTGYNVYRSVDPSLSQALWTQVASDASDEDPLLPGVQWIDLGGSPRSGIAFYYRSAAYNSPCGSEGPW